MKKKSIQLAVIFLGMFILSGCGKKTPNPSDGTEIVGDTVSINDNPYGNTENTNGSSGSGGYNSSSDGFESIYFTFGAYSIDNDMQERMQLNTRVAHNKTKRIKIEGNCDEFGTDEYNYALGLKRAKVVKDTLVSQGIAKNKILLVSFGESNPICSSGTSSCYEQNRRVDLHLVR